MHALRTPRAIAFLVAGLAAIFSAVFVYPQFLAKSSGNRKATPPEPSLVSASTATTTIQSIGAGGASRTPDGSMAKSDEKKDSQFFVMKDGSAIDLSSPSTSMHEEANYGARDPAWSQGTEKLLREFLEASSDLKPLAKVVNIRCSAKVCEIQVSGHSAEQADSLALLWQSSLLNPSNHLWWSGYGLGQPLTSTRKTSNGQLLIAAYLPRLQDQPEAPNP